METLELFSPSPEDSCLHPAQVHDELSGWGGILILTDIPNSDDSLGRTSPLL